MGSVVDLCVVSVMKMTFTEIARLVILTWVMKLNQDGTGQVVAIDVIAGTIKVVFEKGRAPLTYGVEEVQLNGKSVNCMINSRNYHKILMSMLAEVEAIKANFSGILDENTALKLENDKLREHLSQVVQEETGTKMSHGKVNLEAIYDDGFHICPDFYGQRRDNNEACGFCAELLYGD